MKRLLCYWLILVLTAACVPAWAEGTADPVADTVAMLRDPAQASALFDRLTPEMQSALPAAALAGLWPQLEASGGAFVALEDDGFSTEQAGLTIYTRTVRMTSMSLACTLVLDGEGLIAGLSFTPVARFETPGSDAVQLPDGVTEEEVTVGEAPWQLPGTLTMPSAEGKLPAVVLVHGSGPSDRDETVGAVKPFRDLAYGLARQGIAVLRYDKRTRVHAQAIASDAETYAAFTVEEETIQDAIAAARLLAADERIDARRIFVLGHSLGAMLAPRIVSESEGLFAGMVLACGTDRTLLDIMVRQNETAAAAVIRTNPDAGALVEEQLRQMHQEVEAFALMDEESARKATVFGQPGLYFYDMAQSPSASELMAELALPALVINGERDFQIIPAEGRETWERVLPMDAPWLTCLWADVNHMLMKPDVPENAAGTTAEYETPCAVDEAIIMAIGDFVLNTEETK